MDKLIESIKRHEGFKDAVYLDSEGKPTCGWGHYLWIGSKVPLEASEAFFKQDIAEAVSEFSKLPSRFRNRLNESRRRIVVELIFNMNLQKILQFKKFWAAVELEDWVEAKAQLLDSRWATQVKGRAIELANRFLEGTD
jgi:lysozyme